MKKDRGILSNNIKFIELYEAFNELQIGEEFDTNLIIGRIIDKMGGNEELFEKKYGKSGTKVSITLEHTLYLHGYSEMLCNYPQYRRYVKIRNKEIRTNIYDVLGIKNTTDENTRKLIEANKLINEVINKNRERISLNTSPFSMPFENMRGE